jgi:putative transposase
MQRFKSARYAQRFLSDHVFIYGHFHPGRNRVTARNYRTAPALAFKIRTEETYARNTA